MPTVPLPNDPSLEQLRTQAKELRDEARAGARPALDLVAEFHPNGAHAVALSGAQLVIARRYGFASWARLKRHLEVVDRYGRAPDDVAPSTNAADEFLRLACLRYGEDDAPARWDDARQLLADHPSLSASSMHVAAAVADVTSVQAFVARDPSMAHREGGPIRWEPLLYLSHARHDPNVAEEAVLTTARLLLDHGADANAGYLWHGTYPFTALTGAFGGGELGPAAQPPHPHAYALASLLLDAGADPNDSQALYNRQFESDDQHLTLLFAHGLGRGDGGPWRARLGDAVDAPAALVRIQLWWAVVHDHRARVRLLVEHGVDFTTPFASSDGMPSWATTGCTPCELAAQNGNVEMVQYLVSRGATRPTLEGVDALVAAILAGDRAAVGPLRSFLDDARARRPGLVVWAGALGRLDALELLVELGFDVDALGRSDVPKEEPWQTALHKAAGDGDLEAARLLVSLGADPNRHDARFDATPLGWARHFDQQAVIELLVPITS